MTTFATDYLAAVRHVPEGGTLVLSGTTWDGYEQLLAELGDSYAVRITFDQGRLIIMSPSWKDDYWTEIISRLVYVMAEETNRELESLGSTTFRQAWLQSGVEPDACFYVRNAARIIGKEQIDLALDPPPDIVVEVDVAHRSDAKSPIYAGMKVPELWICGERGVKLYQLGEDGYNEVPASETFPLITGEVIARFVNQSKGEGQSATIRLFREWVRKQGEGRKD